jgi:hypothetical protein
VLLILEAQTRNTFASHSYDDIWAVFHYFLLAFAEIALLKLGLAQ